MSGPSLDNNEVQNVRERYDRRRTSLACGAYSMLNPAVYMGVQERERALIGCLKKVGMTNFQDETVLEVGCGSGSNLLEMIRLGFEPRNLVGNELLEERVTIARERLPASLHIIAGDATTLVLPENSFDIVYQSTVFTSILDCDFQQKLADKMWSLVKPGGGVLWYDFTYDNPRNLDVKGIPVKRIKELFPYGEIKIWRVTLAPPISRRVVRLHPGLYTLFNSLSFLRTHVLCWIKKVG